MNYFSKVEKTLKSCLKEKLSITTATIVGFLIMGSVSWGMTINNSTPNCNNPELEQADVQVEGTTIQVEGTTISEENKTGIYVGADSSNTGESINIVTDLTNKSTSDKELKEKGWLLTVSSTNTNDQIDVNISEGVTLKGENLTRTTLNLYGNTNTTNKGTIEKAEKGWAAVTVGAIPAEGKATFTNLGTVEGSINIEGNVTITNSGKIAGVIYSDDSSSYKGGTKTIELSGNSDIDGIEMKNKSAATVNIKDNTDEMELISGDVKLNISNSNIVVKGGDITGTTVESTGLLNTTNSNLTTGINITGTGETNPKNSVLLNNYGTTAGTYTLINSGNLTSQRVQSAIYTNAGKDVTMNVTNSGNVAVGDKSKWVTGLNGKFDTEVENAKITITNNGKVVVNNGAGIDITNAGKESNVGKAINGENGYIEINGFGVGVLVEGKGVEGINNGIIAMKDSAKGGSDSASLSYGMQAKGGATVTNNGTIILDYGEDEGRVVKALGTEGEGSTAINNGKIKLNDVVKADTTEWSKETIFKELGIDNLGGMIVDKYGINIFDEATESEIGLDGGTTTAGELAGQVSDNNSTGIVISSAGGTITASKTEENEEADEISTDYINVNGVLNVQKAEGNGATEVKIADAVINLDANGKVAVGEGATLTLNGGSINGTTEKEGKEDITLGNGSALALNGTTVNGNIVGVTESESTSSVKVAGSSSLDGFIKVSQIDIGGNEKAREATTRDNKFVLSSSSIIGEKAAEQTVSAIGGTTITTINIQTNGQLVLEIGANGENALGNSTGVEVKGTDKTKEQVTAAEDTNGDILLSTGNVTGTGIEINLGTGNTLSGVTVSTENGKNGVYTAEVGENNKVTLTYNTNLFAGDGALNSINNGAMGVNNLFDNSNLSVRKAQMSNIYEGSIYSETTRAAYNSVKGFENLLRTNNTVVEAGKWTSFGNAVYAKDKYDREVSNSSIETSGLMAGAEYGLDATTSVGVAFAGANQDVSSATGSADGTTLYLGAYAKKALGNYEFVAGIGYQYGNYDADNTTGYGASSDDYNSNTLSTYVEGRYSFDLGSDVAFQPKLKLGYTYVDQENAEDANIRVSDAELSTFDAEVGADLVKTYALKSGKANLVFGASYVRALGDTDKEFTGTFAKSNQGFDIKGAELSENTGKFTLSLEVSKDTGLFYNGGVNLNVGSDNYRNYGVNVGVGYKF